MRRTLLVGLLGVLLLGCTGQPQQRPAPPPPEIKVERSETTGNAVITVRYVNHSRQQNSNENYVTLTTLEEVRAYRKQAEFLISQLDEAEKRMTVNEQQK